MGLQISPQPAEAFHAHISFPILSSFLFSPPLTLSYLLLIKTYLLPSQKPSYTMSASPSRQQPKKILKRRVAFAPKARCKPTLALSAYTDSELDRCWWSPDEMSIIRSEVREMANFLTHNSQQHAKSCASIEYRGIECRTAQGVKRRNFHKNKGWDAVLDTQLDQRYDGPESYEECAAQIASQYQPISFKAAALAHVVALGDMRAAQDEIDNLSDRLQRQKLQASAISPSVTRSRQFRKIFSVAA